jgi:hypothetical protein
LITHTHTHTHKHTQTHIHLHTQADTEDLGLTQLLGEGAAEQVGKPQDYMNQGYVCVCEYVHVCLCSGPVLLA